MATLRTENVDGSYIDSDDDSASDICAFCKREPAPDVRRIMYSRNGYQTYPLEICASCRIDLIHHLSLG